MFSIAYMTAVVTSHSSREDNELKNAHLCHLPDPAVTGLDGKRMQARRQGLHPLPSWELYLPGSPSAQGRLQCRPETLHSSDKSWTKQIHTVLHTHSVTGSHFKTRVITVENEEITKEHVNLHRHSHFTCDVFMFLLRSRLSFRMFLVVICMWVQVSSKYKVTNVTDILDFHFGCWKALQSLVTPYTQKLTLAHLFRLD